MIAELFGTNVFSRAVMQQYLSPEDFARLTAVQEKNIPLTMKTADAVAAAMQRWALEKGATHYCHWFQPLTGNTAQKHDSFLCGSRDGRAILRLTGKQLLQGESDASSFPTGGLRQTAYARGYTAWDMTSPVFLREEAAGTVLCIPTVFLSPTGDALDTKTPLLRSMDALDRQARRILALFGQTAEKIVPYVGAEQEYFLIDREQYRKRRDLRYCGRTLFGAPPPKGQELDDQYFGTLRQRQGAFMAAVDRALWKLGVPASVRHNEVAPAQHELACIYTVANVAADQNQLVMETLKQMAGQFGLVCLLHEKPFAGINGSGKHNNWSLGGEGVGNLLDPGKNPGENLRFQLILACILQAVDRHAPLLRLAAADPGNDLRLGGQEAPPAVISVYLGDPLDAMVRNLLQGQPGHSADPGTLDAGVAAVPPLEKDTADRNRTSPFAFTGNKFEFRMVGAAQSVAEANTVLNTAVAQAFCEAADALEGTADFDRDCRALIRQLLERHQRILFRGDGYSRDWAAEAQRRGLPALPGMVDAIGALQTQEAAELFSRFRVYSRGELESRAEVLYENYIKRIRIEAKTMLRMVAKEYLPGAMAFAGELAQQIHALRRALPGQEPVAQRALLTRTVTLLEQLQQGQEALAGALDARKDRTDTAALAREFSRQVVPLMEQLRMAVDQLELTVSRDRWPVPTYGDLLFEV